MGTMQVRADDVRACKHPYAEVMQVGRSMHANCMRPGESPYEAHGIQQTCRPRKNMYGTRTDVWGLLQAQNHSEPVSGSYESLTFGRGLHGAPTVQKSAGPYSIPSDYPQVLTDTARDFHVTEAF